MSNTILLSVRIDKRTMDRIEDYTKRVRYWKRNAVINQLLTALMDTTNKEDLDKLMRYFSNDPIHKTQISVNQERVCDIEKPP